MSVVRGIFGWVGRRSILFLLLVAALVAHRLIGPSFQSFGALRATAAQLEQEAGGLRAFTVAAIDRSNGGVADAHRLSREALTRKIAVAARARDERSTACGGDLKTLLRSGAEEVVNNRRRCIEGSLYAREVSALTALRDTADVRRPGESLAQAVRRQTGTMRKATILNAQSRTSIHALNKEPFGSFRHRAAIARLAVTANRARAAYDAAKGRAARLITAQGALDAGTRRARAVMTSTQAAFDKLIGDTRAELGGNAVEQARGWAEWVGLDRILRTAALAFVAVIATPYLIRLVFYFVLAPIAARRPAIRLRVPGGTAAIPLTARSAASVGVRLEQGEELLVRQDYLQSTAHGGDKSTRWLLDCRHPLSSIVTGLTFLTRIRDVDDLTTVSAVRDPFAEVTVLTLPEGAACVVQPHALAAVAQPIRRGLRVSSHWRLFSLNAWLTLQLRYLVFHGPARLVIKGRRGVSVEAAERGRVFGQDQLVGFSADLAYSVTRTETFWPYFFGRETLLKDRIEGGDGVLIVEEAPMAGRKAGEVRHGLEGAMDAALKVFGL